MIAANAKTILKVTDLSTTFHNEKSGLHVLDHINFEVLDSEFVCILGPSGSGKSTLLRILAGLLPYSQGEITLDGENLVGPRPGVGIVFQNSNLMPWRTVLENIQLPLDLQNNSDKNEKVSHNLIELVGLQGFEDVLPRDLSGGMAQRVAIARAMVHDPGLLLLDEPFGALDAITRERMGEELLRIWNARLKTVLMVTHNISEALYLADRVIVLSDRPAQICLNLEVDLPRPRIEEMRYTKKFGLQAKKLREAIG